MTDIITRAQELATNGHTPGPWRWYWDQGIISLQGADGTAIATDLNVAEADMLAAAPDLAHTVIAQAEQIKRLQAVIWGVEEASNGAFLSAHFNGGTLTAADMEES